MQNNPPETSNLLTHKLSAAKTIKIEKGLRFHLYSKCRIVDSVINLGKFLCKYFIRIPAILLNFLTRRIRIRNSNAKHLNDLSSDPLGRRKWSHYVFEWVT